MPFVPGAASVLASACVVGSENKPVWMSLTTIGACGLVRFWGSNGSAGGASQILAVAACSVTTTPVYGPFISACGVYVEGPSGTGASAHVWMQK